MTYENQISIKPTSKIDDFYKVYIPKIVRNKISFEKGEKVAIHININEESIMLKKIK